MNTFRSLLEELAAPLMTTIQTGDGEYRCGICEALRDHEDSVDEDNLVDVHTSDCLVIRVRAALMVRKAVKDSCRGIE